MSATGRTHDQKARTSKTAQKRTKNLGQEPHDVKPTFPSSFAFENLEEQTSHALSLLRLLERVCMDQHDTNLQLSDEELDDMAMLLSYSRKWLEPLDLVGVASGLDVKQFTMMHSEGHSQPSIVCTRCSQEREG